MTAHDDHDTRSVATFRPPDQTGEWERDRTDLTVVRWRHRTTGRTATTPVEHTRQTRVVGPWIADGQQDLEL